MSSVKSLMSPSPQQTTHRMEPSGEMRMEANFRERERGGGREQKDSNWKQTWSSLLPGCPPHPG